MWANEAAREFFGLDAGSAGGVASRESAAAAGGAVAGGGQPPLASDGAGVGLSWLLGAPEAQALASLLHRLFHDGERRATLSLPPARASGRRQGVLLEASVAALDGASGRPVAVVTMRPLAGQEEDADDRRDLIAHRHAVLAQAARLCAAAARPCDVFERAARVALRLLDADASVACADAGSAGAGDLVASSCGRWRGVGLPEDEAPGLLSRFDEPASSADPRWLVARPEARWSDEPLALAVRRSEGGWTKDDREFLTELAEVLGPALRLALRWSALREADEANRMLLRSLGRLSEPGSLTEHMERVCAAALELVGGAWAYLRLLSADGEHFDRVFGPQGRSRATRPPPVGLPPLAELARAAARRGEILVASRQAGSAVPLGQDLLDLGTLKAIGVPLRTTERVVGVLLLGVEGENQLTGAEQDQLRAFAAFAAEALQAADLFERVGDSEARYRALFEQSAAAVLVTDDEGWVQLANQRAVDITGWQRPEIEGRVKALLLTAPEEWPRLAEVERRVRGGTADIPCNYEAVMVRPTGERRRVLASVGYIPETEEGIIAFADVTAERELERQVVQMGRIAALGQMVAGVAHELNSPLGAILGSAELALRERASPSVEAHLKRILEQTDRCRRVLEQLLAFARERPAQRVPMDVTAVVRHALDMQRHALAMENIDVYPKLEKETPYVLGDPARLEQVVVNLLTNARQAMQDQPGGRLAVAVDHRRGRVVLTVEDTGPGIRPEHVPMVFEPFFTTKAPGLGTGLGLSVSLGIVHEMGGQIRVESTPGEGARFLVELPPASRADEGGDALSAARGLVGAGSAAGGSGAAAKSPGEGPAATAPLGEALGDLAPEGPALRVLVVDDDAAVRDVLEAALTADGCAVDCARDGAEALVSLVRSEYDVILCDLRIPGMDGQRLYQRLADEKPSVAERLVLVTGDTVSERSQRFLERVRVPVLRKPFRLAELREIVGRVVAKSHG